MKIFKLAAALLCCVLLAGCGNQEPETQVFYDIETEEEELDFVQARGKTVLGMQFLQGEPVMLMAYWTAPGEKGDLYLCRADGSEELLAPGIVDYFEFSNWYVDNDRTIYGVERATSENSGLFAKFDSRGREICRIVLEDDLMDICQTANGQVYLLRQKGLDSPKWLETLDAEAGKTVRVGGDLQLAAETECLGAGPEGLFFMRSYYSQPIFMKMDLKAESADSFLTTVGTTYIPKLVQQNESMRIQDFQVSEDGGVEILWHDNKTGGTVLERLKEVRVEKIPLTMRALTYNGEEWLKQQAARFNRENEKYHVVLEDCGDDSGWDAVTRRQNREEYAKLTSVEMATGAGPDLLYGYVLQDYAAGMAEKGGFEDLAPYMERTGVREEDYYPLTFAGWRDGGKIYSVRLSVSAREYLMNEAVLGPGREPGSMEELTDGLLAWQGDQIFLERTDQAGLLELFLSGTENLWGMVDWEKGTCDFSGELFGKLLKVAKRYGDDGTGKRAPLAVTNNVSKYLIEFVSSSDRKEEGLVRAGVLFDDGCHAVTYDYGPMMINANSANKEGAWEFIRFLLSEEAQSVCNIGRDGRSPVYKALFPAYLEAQRDRWFTNNTSKTVRQFVQKWVDGERVQVEVVYGEEELSDREMEEYLATLEDARERPVRTRPMIEIICEEAGGYFAGDKSAEETAAIVQRRVQVYLDEIF